MVDYRLCQFCHLKPRSFQSSWNRLNCPEKTSEFQKPKRRRRTIGGERALLIPRVTWTRRNSLSIKSSLVATRRQHRVIPVVQARLPPCVDGSPRLVTRPRFRSTMARHRACLGTRNVWCQCSSSKVKFAPTWTSQGKPARKARIEDGDNGWLPNWLPPGRARTDTVESILENGTLTIRQYPHEIFFTYPRKILFTA